MVTFKPLKYPHSSMESAESICDGQPVVSVHETEKQITIDYLFTGFHHFKVHPRQINGQEVQFDQVMIKNTGFLINPGMPMLPSFGRYVQIPGNCGYTVKLKKRRLVTFNNINVVPAQIHATDDLDEEKRFKYDTECYFRDECYPRDIVRVSGPYNIDNYHSLLVHVTPLQFNPKKKQLRCYRNVSVTLKINTVGKKRKNRDIPGSREGFGNLLLNPGQRIENKLGLAPGTVSVQRSGPELLIIYDAEFGCAAKRLADWKESRGIETRLASITEIGNTAAEIKAFIRGMKNGSFSRLGYVLLLGDVEAITPEKIHNPLHGSNPTDYYYSTQYDENTPDLSNPGCRLFMPWISIGRIPVQHEENPDNIDASAMAVVEKIIDYEKNPPEDDLDYYKRMTFVAAFDDTDSPGDQRDNCTYLETVEYIQSFMASQGYIGERVYLTNNKDDQLYYMDGTPIPDDVRHEMIYKDSEQIAIQKLIDAIKRGQLIVCQRGHGLTDGWLRPRFNKGHLALASSDKYSIFYSISCWTGMFDSSGPQECFAEKNLRMRGAAPSLIASTRESYTVLNDDLLKALFDATFAGVLPTFPGTTASYPIKNSRLGDILNYAKSYLLVSVNPDDFGVEYLKEQLEFYHVIGDPTLELWKEPPRALEMQARMVGKVLDIKLAVCPSGCVVTIWSGDDVFKRIEPSSTHMTITRPAGRPVRVSCWAPGYRYAEAVIP